jgi:hypothetical protein
MNTRSCGINTENGEVTQSSSYRHIRKYHIVGKLLVQILVSRVLWELNKLGLLCDEQVVFRPRHSTTLELALLVQTVNRNSDLRRLTGAVFLDMSKAFDTIYVKGFLYKVMS